MLELNFSPFPEIKTERLLLRRLTDADATEIFLMRSDEAVMKYIDREKPKSLDEAIAFIKLVNANIEKNEAIISTDKSKVCVRIIQTNEQLMIARLVCLVMNYGIKH